MKQIVYGITDDEGVIHNLNDVYSNRQAAESDLNMFYQLSEFASVRGKCTKVKAFELKPYFGIE